MRLVLHAIVSRTRRGLGCVLAFVGFASCGPVEPVTADQFSYQVGRTYGVLEVVGQTELSGGYVMIFCPIVGQHIGVQFAGHCTLSPGGEETPWALMDSWPIYSAGTRRYIIAEFKKMGAAPTFSPGAGQPREFGFLIARFGSRAYVDQAIARMTLTPGKVHILGRFDLSKFRGSQAGPVQIGNDAALEAAFRAAFPAIPEGFIDRPSVTRVAADCGRTDGLIDGTGWNCVLQE